MSWPELAFIAFSCVMCFALGYLVGFGSFPSAYRRYRRDVENDV